MLPIQENISLKLYNTFGIEAKAKFFVEIFHIADLIDLLNNSKFKTTKKLFLGGGSNILLLADFDGLVIKISISGNEIITENIDHVHIKVGGGVNWHAFVMYAVSNNWAGVENLSLIPGTVGAAPMQNIGAYGVELKEVFINLEALNLETLEIEAFDKAKCNFGYRESFFKHQGKDKYVIVNVTFELKKNPVFKTTYGAINDTLAEMNEKELSIRAISDAVIKIRESKLPNPLEIGNAGSFFKNPEISKDQFETLKKIHTEMPGFVISENIVKVPAGWLIEQAGWKGKRFGDAGVHTKQALVLVNYGNAKGQEIKNLAFDIKADVKSKFGIDISPEVNFIG